MFDGLAVNDTRPLSAISSWHSAVIELDCALGMSRGIEQDMGRRIPSRVFAATSRADGKNDGPNRIIRSTVKRRFETAVQGGLDGLPFTGRVLQTGIDAGNVKKGMIMMIPVASIRGSILVEFNSAIHQVRSRSSGGRYESCQQSGRLSVVKVIPVITLQQGLHHPSVPLIVITVLSDSIKEVGCPDREENRFAQGMHAVVFIQANR